MFIFDYSDATFYIFLTVAIMFIDATHNAYLATTSPRRHADRGLFWGIVGEAGFAIAGLTVLLA